MNETKQNEGERWGNWTEQGRERFGDNKNETKREGSRSKVRDSGWRE